MSVPRTINPVDQQQSQQQQYGYAPQSPSQQQQQYQQQQYQQQQQQPPPPSYNAPPSATQPPSATPPSATQPSATQKPSATPPSATPPSATPPSATPTPSDESAGESPDEKATNQEARVPQNESDLQAWLKGFTGPSETSESGGSGAYLSYDWFIALTVLGGWVGLDHLYLRSPWSFLAKLLINTLFFGLWYFYDILQAFSNKDVIKVYGIGLPGFPAKRVAMGVLAMDAPGKKHANFFIYALCLLMGGLFGLDSFLVGDRDTGIIRLLCLVSVIGMPIAFCWWIYKLFQFFTDTPSVVNQYASYFGSGGGGWSVFGSLLDPRTIIGTIVQPFGMAAKTAMTAWKETATAAKESIAMGKTIVGAVGTAAELLSKTGPPSSTLKPDVLTQVVAALKQPATQGETTQGGGAASNLNALPYTLLGTIVLIALSGFVATYYRSKKHVAPHDDRPPEPGVFRKPDSKEYAA